MSSEPFDAIPRSRRNILTRTANALGLLGAAVVARPASALAGSNPSMVLNIDNNSQNATGITRFTSPTSNVSFTGSAYAISANAPMADGAAVLASATGARGVGVHGLTGGGADQIGVLADVSGGSGLGIALQAAAGNGTAVMAKATGGYALDVIGVSVFSRSGLVAFAKGQASHQVDAFFNRSDALVVATIQGDVAGTWVRGVSVDLPHGHFTIRLNKAAPKTLKVGWFIVN